MYDFDPGIIGAPNGFGAATKGVDVPVDMPVGKVLVAEAIVPVPLLYCTVCPCNGNGDCVSNPPAVAVTVVVPAVTVTVTVPMSAGQVSTLAAAAAASNRPESQVLEICNIMNYNIIVRAKDSGCLYYD